MPGIDKHISAAHMVLGRDLNPHDTLFAGQAASYMIECAFLAVQAYLGTPHIVCLGLDGFRFLRPVKKGDTFTIDSAVIHTGATSVAVYITLTRGSDGEKAAECFTTFVHIDEASGHAVPHHTPFVETSEEIKVLEAQYLAYKKAGSCKK